MNNTNSITISQLKMNPMAAINMADDYPLEVFNRGTSKAYLVGKKLFDQIVEWMEDMEDKRAIDYALKSGELDEAEDFEEFAAKLGI